MTLRISAEADDKLGPGHAVILVEGARVAPDDIRLTIRRPGYREDCLGPAGWQAAEAVLTPDAAYVAGGTLTLHVGPAMVSHMEPGMNVALALVLPDGAVIDGRLAWPAIAGPIGGAGARRGRMVATRRTVVEGPSLRSGGALVGDGDDSKAARDAALATAAAAAGQVAAAEDVHGSEARAGDASASPPPAEPDPAGDASAETPEAEPDTGAAPEGPSEAVETSHARRDELRATRDVPPRLVAGRGPWRRRVAAVAAIAVVLIAGTAVASYYLGRDQICGDSSIGPLVDGWGLCPPVVVAQADEPEPPVPASETEANEGRGWNIDPLAWLGPYWNGSDESMDRGAPEPAGGDEPAGAAAPPVPDTPATQRALARAYLDTNPSPEAAFARAEALFAEAQVEAAFLIYRYAAEGGHDDAAAEVAAMYDPQTYSPQTSPLPRPNPEQARIWYQRAVDGGNTQSLLPLARLLAADDAIEDARAVLRLAEEAGLADAARLLEELQ